MLLDRVVETTDVTGTGTMNLLGAAAIDGVTMRRFSVAAGSGATVAYLIVDTAGGWELGLGVVTSGSPDTLTRATILRSSNSDAAVSFSAGTKYVYGDVGGDLIRFRAGGLPTAGGTANARTMTNAPTLKALVTGMLFAIINGAAANTTTNPTLQVDSISAKTIVRPDGGALLVGDMPASALLVFLYDGTSMRLLNPQSAAAQGTWADLASASTADLSTVAGINVRITGTTTITALGTSPSGTYKRLRFAGALTFTYNATSLILPGAASITTAADDCADMVSLGSGNWICTGYQRAASLGSGKVVDRAYAEYTANTSLTTTIPYDDTIPQNSEGTQVLSASLTPKKTTNRVRVTVLGFATADGVTGGLVLAALFRNSTADAINATGAACLTTTNGLQNLVMGYEDSPGSVSAQTYNVRVGPNAAGNARVNGTSAGRLFGGVARMVLILEELE